MRLVKQTEIIVKSLVQAIPSLLYVTMMTMIVTCVYWLIGMNFFVEKEREERVHIFTR